MPIDEEEYYLNQIPKPRPTRLQPKRISTLMSSFLTKRGIATGESNDVIKRLLDECVGPTLAAETRVGKLFRGNLYISVSSHLVVQELQMRIPEILKHLRSDPTLEKIKGLKFVLEN